MTVTPFRPHTQPQSPSILEEEELHCEHATFEFDTPECPASSDWRAFLWPCADHSEGCEGHGFCHAHMAALLLDRVHRGLIAAIQRVSRD